MILCGPSDMRTSALILQTRVLRISCLARLSAAKQAAFQFVFRLEPIVHVKAWLFAAFEIDFVYATSDFLGTLAFPTDTSPASPWVEVVWSSVPPLLFAFDAISISLLLHLSAVGRDPIVPS